MVFQGLTEAFIASAQFNDLLAPIQQQIKIFTEQALATGEAPNVGAFRAATFPLIEQIASRGQLLGPLIDVLQELGLDLRNFLGLVPAQAAPPEPQQVVHITINGALDPNAVADQINRLLGAHLRGSLPLSF